MGVGKGWIFAWNYGPDNASYPHFQWSSSNPSVATVNGGYITAKKAGTTTITVYAADGSGLTDSFTLTVKAKPSSGNNSLSSNSGNISSKKSVQRVVLSSTLETLYVGDVFTLKPTIYPNNAANKTVTWSSSNTGVASVNSSGKITAKKAGIATITVKTKDGSKTAICKLDIKLLPVYNTYGDYGGDQAGPLNAFQNGDQEIKKIVQRYYPELNTNEKVLNFLRDLNSEGCGYVALINTVFVHFQKDPDRFKEKFNFSLYSCDSSGKAHYNFNYLITDFYCATDVKSWNFLWIEFEQGTTNINRKSRFEKYMNSYNVPVEVKNWGDWGDIILPTVQNYNKYKGEGQIIMRCSPVKMYSSNWSSHYSKGGHAMTVTGVEDNNHLRLSSWGDLYYFNMNDYTDFEVAMDPPNFQIIIYK